MRITWLFLFSNAPLIYSSPIKAAGVNLPAILTWIITKFSTRLVIRDVTDSLMNLAFYLVTPDTCLPCERLWQISTPVVLWCDSLRHKLVQWSSLKLRRINAIISHVKVHRLTAATELRGRGAMHISVTLRWWTWLLADVDVATGDDHSVGANRVHPTLIVQVHGHPATLVFTTIIQSVPCRNRRQTGQAGWILNKQWSIVIGNTFSSSIHD